MMKILLTGATGQLGAELCEVLADQGHFVVPLSHDDIEISDGDLVDKLCIQEKPDVIINTAAMHNVENCELDPLSAYNINAVGARNLAKAATAGGSTLVHVSTDYVFDGKKGSPYTELDAPVPLNVYGNTKLSGEMFVRTEAPKHLILRVSGLYGVNPCRAKGGRNFVTTMLKLASERDEVRVVDDEILSPTHTLDIARQIDKLLRAEKFGTFHVSSQGQCSWYAFARRIFDLRGITTKLSIAASDEFPAKVRRPLYSTLDNTRLREHGLDIMPSWEDGVAEYLDRL